MIWFLLFICIVGTIFCIEQLFSILGTHIGITTISQSINVLTEQKEAEESRITRLVYDRNEIMEIRDKAQKFFTIASIILSVLWTLFFYLWN